MLSACVRLTAQAHVFVTDVSLTASHGATWSFGVATCAKIRVMAALHLCTWDLCSHWFQDIACFAIERCTVSILGTACLIFRLLANTVCTKDLVCMWLHAVAVWTSKVRTSAQTVAACVDILGYTLRLVTENVLRTSLQNLAPWASESRASPHRITALIVQAGGCVTSDVYRIHLLACFAHALIVRTPLTWYAALCLVPQSADRTLAEQPDTVWLWH
mmetsp:Transcript_54226/g.126608  ORF Transcript_54226/g.126608 Transcript_54226/m.126608 type:complete len:217 (-) Transcript_54226:3970-4620(-)